VVFSAPSGQTLLLEPVFADVLGDAGASALCDPIRVHEDGPLGEVRAQCAEQLVGLGILVAVA
jgi:hypothetical protein